MSLVKWIAVSLLLLRRFNQRPETSEELKARIHEEEYRLTVKGTQLAISHLWEERSKSG